MKFLHVDRKSLFLAVFSVIMMGLALTYLDLCNFGTDPCTCTNLGIAEKIGWSLGNWQALINSLLLIIVIVFQRDQIGWGTLANMFLVGYSYDLFSWINGMLVPVEIFDSMVVRVGVAIPALALFIVAASCYMAVQLGTAPYDAISFLIAKKIEKIPFKVVRIIYDMFFALTGFLLGQTVGVVTIIMAFCLGPAISWMRTNFVEKYILTKSEDHIEI